MRTWRIQRGVRLSYRGLCIILGTEREVHCIPVVMNLRICRTDIRARYSPLVLLLVFWFSTFTLLYLYAVAVVLHHHHSRTDAVFVFAMTMMLYSLVSLRFLHSESCGVTGDLSFGYWGGTRAREGSHITLNMVHFEKSKASERGSKRVR